MEAKEADEEGAVAAAAEADGADVDGEREGGRSGVANNVYGHRHVRMHDSEGLDSEDHLPPRPSQRHSNVVNGSTLR